MRLLVLIAVLFVFIFLVGCTTNNADSTTNTTSIKDETGGVLKSIITKDEYLTEGKVINFEDGSGKRLKIGNSTRFNVMVNASKLVESPYTKTKCVYYRAVEEDNSDPDVSLHIRTLIGTGGNITIEAKEGFAIEAGMIKTEPYFTGNFVYSLTPIETKEGNITKTEYCLIPGKEYMLEIFVFGSAYENDEGGVTYGQYFHFYFSDRVYDETQGKFVK